MLTTKQPKTKEKKGASINALCSNNRFAEFIERLLDKKGFTGLDPEIRSELKIDLVERLDDFVAARIVSQLSDDDLVEFEGILERKASDAEVQQFIATHIHDFVNFLAATLMEFEGVYLGKIPTRTIIENSYSDDNIDETISSSMTTVFTGEKSN